MNNLRSISALIQSILDILDTITWKKQEVANFVESLKPYLESQKSLMDLLITEKENYCSTEAKESTTSAQSTAGPTTEKQPTNKATTNTATSTLEKSKMPLKKLNWRTYK